MPLPEITYIMDTLSQEVRLLFRIFGVASLFGPLSPSDLLDRGFTHDPDTYHDPMGFKPERFLSSEDQNPEMDPHVLSFGFGRRICPGKEFADASLYLYIAMSLSVFNITKPLNSDLQARFTAAMLSHPKTFKVDITARSVKAENLIRSVEVEHPFEASDSETFTRLVI